MLSLIAQNEIDIGTELKFQNQPASQAFPNLSSLTNPLLKNAYLFTGILIFVGILFGGFTLLTAGTNPDKQQQGKKIITSALIGAFLVFTSYWIIQIIEVVTGLKILNPGL